MRRLLVVLAGSIVALLLAGPALAAPEDVANQVSNEFMSPYCDGVVLHDCPSDSAVALRDRITRWAEGGMTKAQILDRLVDEFGAKYLAKPAGTGAGLFAWVLPVIAIAGGALLLWLLLTRWTKPSGGAPAAPVSNADHERVQAEMEKLRTTG